MYGTVVRLYCELTDQSKKEDPKYVDLSLPAIPKAPFLLSPSNICLSVQNRNHPHTSNLCRLQIATPRRQSLTNRSHVNTYSCHTP
jgi:hypothetical protein